MGKPTANQTVAVASALAWFAVVEHTLVNLAPGIGRWLPAAAGQAIVRSSFHQAPQPPFSRHT